MRFFITILSVVSVIGITGCERSLDAERQQHLIREMHRVTGIKENAATALSPNSYEYCGNALYPCPTVTPLNDHH